MNRRNFILGLFLLFGMIFVLSSVSALGVTPGRTTLDSSSEPSKSVPFTVLNDAGQDMQVVLYVQGELKDSVTLSENNVRFSSEEQSKAFNYNVNLPGGLSPGLHTAEIVIMRIPDASEDGTFVGATVAVVTQLHAYVPCPGKCIETDLNVLNEDTTAAKFVLPVVNRGKVGIGSLRANIDIYTPLNEKVASLNTDSKSLDAKSRTDLVVDWNANITPGSYLAKVTVFYDELSTSFDKEFALGDASLFIDSIYVNSFELGEIAQLKILVENKWNKNLDEVFANLIIYNHDNEIMADVKSATDLIPALSKKELIAYWDTVGVQVGVYEGKLTVNYGKGESDQNLEFDVKKDDLSITGVGYVVGSGDGGKFDIKNLLIILVVFLVAVNVLWFVLLKRIMKKRKSHG